jgi:ubiquinone biosynthesis protein Coq4
MMPDKVKLEEIIKELQKIMRIQDWDIEVVYTNQYEVKHLMKSDDLDTAMMCERYRLRKEARIYVNVDHSALPTHWYESIVHELYHIVTGEICDITDDLMDEINISETTRRQKKQSGEVMVVHLAKIFTSLCPVTNFEGVIPNESNQG